jgi:hypothetical protein
MLTVLLTLGIALAAFVAGMSGAWSPCGFAMIETFTPQMCGGRRQRNVGVALFAAGAVLASAGLGAVLGLAGSGLPGTWAWALVGMLALLGAARDLGIVRIALPQRRGQVPEPWRRNWPLGAWAPAYGVLLGLGVVTFQVVSTFWVVSGAAIALGNPATSAACFALFGLGRVVMVVVPPPFAPTYSQAAVSIGPALAAVRRVNGLLLVGVGFLALAASPVLGSPAVADTAICHGPTSTGSYWPSLSGGVRAWTLGSASGAPSVIVADPGRSATVPCAWAPSVDGDGLAYVTNGGIAVIRRSTQAQTTFVAGNVVRPSLNSGRLAYVVISPGAGQTLYVRNLERGTIVKIAHVPEGTDISGPSLSGTTIAWAADNGRGSRILVRNIAGTGRAATRVIATAVPNTDLISPSVYGRRICWIIEHGGVRYTSKMLIAPLSGANPRTVWSVSGSTSGGQILWGTSMAAHAIATTVWHYSANHGSIAVRRI